MFAVDEGCADHFVCKWRGFAPQTPRFVKASHALCTNMSCHHHGATTPPLFKAIMPAIQTKHHVCGSFCLQMGWGCAPPNPPDFSRPSMQDQVMTTVVQRLRGSFCSQRGGGGAPPTRCAFLKPSMFKVKHDISVVAVGEGCADHFICKWGGRCSPPQPLAMLKSSVLAVDKMMSSPCLP